MMDKKMKTEELKNMSAEVFKNQLSNRFYSEHIQYLIKKHKKEMIVELTNYFLDNLSEDHELCWQTIGRELESQIDNFRKIKCSEIFDLVQDRYSTWDEAVTDSELIDMYQVNSFLFASYCFINKNLRKAIGVKIGFFLNRGSS